MNKNVSDQLVEILVEAGIQRIYAVTGDSLNHVNAAVHRNGKIKWTDPNALAMPPKLEFDQMKGYSLYMGRMMLSGRMDEVFNMISSNYKHLKEVL